MNIRTCTLLLTSAALAATAACSSATGSAPTGARAVCETMLPGRTVQAWESVTVRDLRAYGYGGPVAHYPLADTFPGLPGSDGAAWCWVRTSQNTGSLWGVVAGHGLGRAITVTGPGGQPHGLMSEPPHVP